jgi:DNA polymerase III gamma/tau subunit
MTKNAQQALRYLLQNYKGSVRFCLICNYISRIDEGLQNEFIRLRFNQLPKENIVKFLRNISDLENLNINNESLNNIQKLFKSDLRSMINFLQSNQDVIKLYNDETFENNSGNINTKLLNIIECKEWEIILSKIKNNENIHHTEKYISLISSKYNIDKKNIIKDFINYIIRNKRVEITNEFLNVIENIMHSQNTSSNTLLINYLVSKINTFVLDTS